MSVNWVMSRDWLRNLGYFMVIQSDFCSPDLEFITCKWYVRLQQIIYFSPRDSTNNFANQIVLITAVVLLPVTETMSTLSLQVKSHHLASAISESHQSRKIHEPHFRETSHTPVPSLKISFTRKFFMDFGTSLTNTYLKTQVKGVIFWNLLDPSLKYK